MPSLKDRVINDLQHDVLEARLPESKPLALDSLTRAELAVTYGLIMGASIEDIAIARGNSPHTVRNHMKAIYRKLNVQNARILTVLYWRQQNDVDLSPSVPEEKVA